MSFSVYYLVFPFFFFFFQAEDGIRDVAVTGVQTCALPICRSGSPGIDIGPPDPCPSARDLRRLIDAGNEPGGNRQAIPGDRKSTRLNSSHGYISYAVFCLKKKNPLLYQWPDHGRRGRADQTGVERR